jgi:hypothetical protein
MAAVESFPTAAVFCVDLRSKFFGILRTLAHYFNSSGAFSRMSRDDAPI